MLSGADLHLCISAELQKGENTAPRYKTHCLGPLGRRISVVFQRNIKTQEHLKPVFEWQFLTCIVEIFLLAAFP